MKQRKKLALFLLVFPGVLLIVSLILFGVTNLIFNPTFWMTPDGETIVPTPTPINILNVIFVGVGAIGLACILPGIIAGTYLLIYKNRKHKDD